MNEEKLTIKEKRDYVRWMHKHKTAKELAAKLGCTVFAVKYICDKLGVKPKSSIDTSKQYQRRSAEEKILSRKEAEEIAMVIVGMIT